MAKYRVIFEVTTRYEVDVNGRSEADAERKAEIKFEEDQDGNSNFVTRPVSHKTYSIEKMR